VICPGSQRARQIGCIPFGGGGGGGGPGGGGGGGAAGGDAIDCTADGACASPQLIVKAKPDICTGSDGGAATSEDLLGEALEIKVGLEQIRRYSQYTLLYCLYLTSFSGLMPD